MKDSKLFFKIIGGLTIILAIIYFLIKGQLGVVSIKVIQIDKSLESSIQLYVALFWAGLLLIKYLIYRKIYFSTLFYDIGISAVCFFVSTLILVIEATNYNNQDQIVVKTEKLKVVNSSESQHIQSRGRKSDLKVVIYRIETDSKDKNLKFISTNSDPKISELSVGDVFSVNYYEGKLGFSFGVLEISKN